MEVATMTENISKLKRLEEAEKHLNAAQREKFENHFIGALSMLVSDEQWEQAIRAATRCLILP